MLPLLAAAYWRHGSPYSQAIGPFPFRAAREGTARTPRIALTFDDGPNEPYTTRIAAILEARGVRGTFFQVGRCLERHPETAPRLVASGHVVGNHSYAHRAMRGWTRPAIADEVARTQAVFEAQTGCRPALYRPPWLIRTSATFRVLAELGMQPVSGEFCHAWEPAQPSAARIARRALAKADDGAIVIFHDGYDDVGAPRGRTVAAVETIVDTLLDRGFELVTVDRLIGAGAYLAG